jgi:hypothetical protein
MTLHVQKGSKTCDDISGWSIIVHTLPENSTASVDTPPTSWVGAQVLVGSFADNEDANYDGKYFRTPEGKLFLVYQKQLHKKPIERDV